MMGYKENNVIFRPYQNGDEKKIVKLLEEVFKQWPDRDIPCSKTDFWKWKYLDSPYKINTISVAEKNEEIIGCYHAQHYYTNFNGESYLTCMGTDVATHPEYRGQGIFNGILDVHLELEKKINTRLNIAVHVNPILIERAKRKISESKDRIFFNRIYEMTYIKDIKLHLDNISQSDNLKKALGFHVLTNISKISNLIKSIPQTTKQVEINSINGFNNDIDTLSEKQNKYCYFNINKSQDYLNWRYCDKRAGEYIVKNASVDDELLGYSVLKINKIKDYNTGNIIDLVAHNDHPYLIDSLIQDALNEFKKHKINVVRQWAIKNSIMETILIKNGFIDTKSGIPILVIKKLDLNIDIEILKRIPSEKINFQMGDTEWM